MMKLYVLDDSYVAHLKRTDTKVADQNEGRRIYIGPVFSNQGLDYFAPLSSPKPQHDSITGSDVRYWKMMPPGENATSLGVIRICNMVPAPRDAYNLLDLGTKPEHYRKLVFKQMRLISGRQADIQQRASTVHLRISEGHPLQMVESCCAFLLLEDACRAYTPTPAPKADTRVAIPDPQLMPKRPTLSLRREPSA